MFGVMFRVFAGVEHASVAGDAVGAFGAGEVALVGVGLGGGPALDQYPGDDDEGQDGRSDERFEEHVILRCRRIP